MDEQLEQGQGEADILISTLRVHLHVRAPDQNTTNPILKSLPTAEFGTGKHHLFMNKIQPLTLYRSSSRAQLPPWPS